MRYKTIEIQEAGAVAVVWLNRPEVRNAFNETLVAELSDSLDALDADKNVRAVAIAGRGPAFCAGGDLNWTRRLGTASSKANVQDARKLTGMFQRLYAMKKPTVARVHGAAYAGALGLIAACDVAVAAQDAEFCLSEVKIGMAAASILPYLVRSMGERHVRRYVLSAEVFTAAEAYRIGLVHELALPQELDTLVDRMLEQMLKGAPAAQSTAKRMIGETAGQPISDALVSSTAGEFAALRAAPEAREGIGAFLEKREPAWRRAPQRKPAAKNPRKG